MGSVFRYVADDALRPSDGDSCQNCGCTDQPLYDYFGDIIDPALTCDPQLAAEDPSVSWLCAPCINGGNVQRTDTWSVETTIARFAADPKAAWASFNTLPCIPLFLQGNLDWPLCCGSWCEFIGSPADLPELIAVQGSHMYWQAGPAKPRRNFACEGEPETLLEISRFRCPTCAQLFYTDQFT